MCVVTLFIFVHSSFFRCKILHQFENKNENNEKSSKKKHIASFLGIMSTNCLLGCFKVNESFLLNKFGWNFFLCVCAKLLRHYLAAAVNGAYEGLD